MAEVKVTKQNFNEEVIKSDLPVVLDFWATWCGPCRMLAPELEKLAEKYAGKIKVGKVNVDEEMELAQAFQVSSIPMVVVMKDGKAVSAAVGYQPAEQLEQLLEKL